MKTSNGDKIICGKCGSSSLYREIIPDTTNLGELACLTCGNRESLYGVKVIKKEVNLSR